jgi:hypothetical protein
LNQLEGNQIETYSSSKFELLIADTSKNDDTLHIIKKSLGTLKSGDVDLEFNSFDGEISLSTYLDEVNSGTLTVINSKPLKLNCSIY